MNNIPEQINNDYGLLINQNIKLHRDWFKEMGRLIGIKFIYRAPRKSKEFDMHGDLDTNYETPITFYGILEEHPNQYSLRKAGWVTELQDNSLLLHVPYDLPGLEQGGLFMLPAGLDGAKSRCFRLLNLQNIMIYPASIVCEIAPEYEDTSPRDEILDFQQNNFTKLLDNEEDD